jgi:hypothetical protein
MGRESDARPSGPYRQESAPVDPPIVNLPMKKRLVGFLAFGLSAMRLAATDLYVSTSGSDQNAGTADAPFATVTKARDRIRELREDGGIPPGGVTVWLAGGTYDQSESIAFGKQDSGTVDRPIVYAAKPGETVRITGARPLEAVWFSKLDSASPVWPRLDPTARGQIYSVNLRQHGIANYGTLKAGGFHIHSVAALELIIDGRPMTVARWPNDGDPLARTATAPSGTRIVYSGKRPERWLQAKDVWLHGLWNTAWADFHVQVAAINPATKTITLAEPPAQFGVGADHPYYAYNLLEEIDEPGEYYLDRDEGVLYLWPPGDLAKASIQMSMLEDNLLEVNRAEHLCFRGLTLEASRGPLLEIAEGNAVRIEDCLLRSGGEYAAQITGSDCGLDHCEILDCGEDGVVLGGGSRASLTAGRNFVTNCRIRRIARINWTYHPAINFAGGCGNVAAHNLIEDLPHAAVLFSGNNHVIEYNEMRRVCRFTSDSGAIYSGRDWGYRGNVIRFNFIHHIESNMEGQGTQGVYLDDCMSSAEVFGNVFYRIDGGAIFCGGGRDNIMRNNIMAYCRMAHYNGDFARGFISDKPGSSWNFLERLNNDGVEYQKEPWASAYPSCAAIPNSWTEIEHGLWRNPEHCVFSDNAGWSNAYWMHQTNFSGTGVFSVYSSISDNNPDEKPMFDESACWDRGRRPAELRASPRGFSPIPFGSIGPSRPGKPDRAPASPRLGCSGVHSTEIDLVWTDAGNLSWQRPEGYTLRRRAGVDGSWETIRTLGSEADVASVEGLAPASSYTFEVVAFNPGGSSESRPLTLSTPPSPLIPGPATRFEAESPLEVIRTVGRSGAVAVASAAMVSGKCVSLFDPGDAIRIRFPASSSGTFRLGVRVRSGAANLPIGTEYWPNGYAFRLDGNAIALAGDPSTVSPETKSFGPTYWGTMYSDPLTLSAGPHSLEVVSEQKWAAVDYVELVPLSPGQGVTPAGQP